MVDRVSTYWMFNRPVSDMNRLQVDMNRTQAQLSTGLRILTPADDPVGSSRVLQLDQEIALMDQYERNIILANARLTHEENTLDAVKDSVDRIRELAVKAGNSGVLTEEDRLAISQEVRERVDELYDLMNTRDASGEYLFAGFSGDNKPFVQSEGGGFRYDGDEGVRYLQVSKTVTVASSDSGKDVFMDVPAVEPSYSTYGNPLNTGFPPGVIGAGITLDQEKLDDFFPNDAVITFENTLDVDPPESNFTVRRKPDGRVVDGMENIPYVSGQNIQFAGMSVKIVGDPSPGDQFVVETSNKQSILTTTEKFLYALESYPPGTGFDETYDKAIEQTLGNLDNAIEKVATVMTRIGARQNTATAVTDQHADNKLAAKSLRSQIRDVDWAEAASRLQMQSVTLQAAQQSFVQTNQLSLFNFIR